MLTCLPEQGEHRVHPQPAGMAGHRASSSSRRAGGEPGASARQGGEGAASTGTPLAAGGGLVVSKGKLEALFGFCGCIQKNSKLPRLRGNSELSSKLQPAEPAQGGAGLCSVATASALLP